MEAADASLKEVMRRHPKAVAMGFRADLAKMMFGAAIGIVESQGGDFKDALRLCEVTIAELEAARAFGAIVS